MRDARQRMRRRARHECWVRTCDRRDTGDCPVSARGGVHRANPCRPGSAGTLASAPRTPLQGSGGARGAGTPSPACFHGAGLRGTPASPRSGRSAASGRFRRTWARTSNVKLGVGTTRLCPRPSTCGLRPAAQRSPRPSLVSAPPRPPESRPAS